jgi:hypothetical protein
VFVSNTVHDHVRDRLPFIFEYLGEQQVKNIARPVRVYRLRPERPSLALPRNPRIKMVWAGGEEMAPSSLENPRWSTPMPQPNDLSRSLTPLLRRWDPRSGQGGPRGKAHRSGLRGQPGRLLAGPLVVGEGVPGRQMSGSHH